MSKSQRSKLPTIKPGPEENIYQDQDWCRRIVSIKMQDCEPSRNILCFSETSSSDWTSTFLPDLLRQTYGESELPWQLRDLAFMLWLLPYKVGILVESLGQLSIRRRTVDTVFAPLPLGTWRWKEQELLRYLFELKQPNLSNLSRPRLRRRLCWVRTLSPHSR